MSEKYVILKIEYKHKTYGVGYHQSIVEKASFINTGHSFESLQDAEKNLAELEKGDYTIIKVYGKD